jgi:hypothetical protein
MAAGRAAEHGAPRRGLSDDDRDPHGPAARVTRAARDLRELAGQTVFQTLGRAGPIAGSAHGARPSGRLAPTELSLIKSVMGLLSAGGMNKKPNRMA